jgi:hypothetical protein
MIKRLRILHQTIFRHHPNNVTKPFEALRRIGNLLFTPPNSPTLAWT